MFSADMAELVKNGLTMLVSELDGSVDPPALLGDVELDLQLLLNQVITRSRKYDIPWKD